MEQIFCGLEIHTRNKNGWLTVVKYGAEWCLTALTFFSAKKMIWGNIENSSLLSPSLSLSLCSLFYVCKCKCTCVHFNVESIGWYRMFLFLTQCSLTDLKHTVFARMTVQFSKTQGSSSVLEFQELFLHPHCLLEIPSRSSHFHSQFLIYWATTQSHPGVTNWRHLFPWIWA